MPNVNDVIFVATYDDGSEEWFGIDPVSLRNGDHVGGTFAAEQQRSGWLPAGNIINVVRKVAGESPTPAR
jgi:hypothetical protein